MSDERRGKREAGKAEVEHGSSKSGQVSDE
jgi:hypothetical protein